MMIKDAFSVLLLTLKDTWEELYSLIIVNMAWFFAVVGLPVLLLSLGNVIVSIAAFVLFVLLFPATIPGIYVVGSIVAHGKTFHFSDFIGGVKKYWWRGLLWFLANLAVIAIIYVDIQFYPTFLQSIFGIMLGGMFIALFVFWAIMQMYFWPLLIEQDQPNLLRAWRNAAFLVLANPFYAFFTGVFSLIFLAISIGLGLIPLAFVGVVLQAVLASNAVLTLLVKFKLIEEVRPAPMTDGR
ncbi:MAG: hypothetical protein GX552_18025 [Chloroflexi bacterium]|nr:hypothetical protein [Chloroflexota bacterium]